MRKYFEGSVSSLSVVPLCGRLYAVVNSNVSSDTQLRLLKAILAPAQAGFEV